MSKRILIVDDEPAISEVVELLLKSEGYDVKVANNGEEGLDLAKKVKPDAIILDVMMPKLSGYMVAGLLAKDSEMKNIPILLLTGKAQIAGGIKLELPTKYKLYKPFKPAELLNLLKKMLA